VGTVRRIAEKAAPFVCCAAILAGCVTPPLHSANEREMTLGVVQKEIRRGLSQADVAEALGSPNIVTRDSTGLETWVYDRSATEASYSNSVAYGTILVIGVAQSAGTSSTSQRTLTVVIKFGNDGKVDSFSYHASRF
jgi:outer membrane protein assembly factor BamE (lipoprotein component of BamABCDE complex)